MELLKVAVAESPLQPACLRLSGHVGYADRQAETYWIDYPAECEGQLSATGNPWLMLLAPLAAARREPLALPLPVDPTLLQNVRELLELWLGWFPEWRMPAFHLEATAPPSRGGRIGSCFSGGVDSFYTFLRHEPAFRLRSKEQPADDLLFVWGFDIGLDKPADRDRIVARLGRVAAQFGKTLLAPASNLRSTRFGKLSWGYQGHGPALAAVALGLEDRLGHLRIPASFRTDMKIKWASSPESVPLFASAGLGFSNDGEDASRTEKTKLVARSDDALAALHVCWQDESDRNCGRCDKCLRTMAALEMLGRLKDCPAFPTRTLGADRIARIFLPGYGADIIAAELREFAEELDRPEIAVAIEQARQRSALIRKLSTLGLKKAPEGRIGKALHRRFTKLLVHVTGSLGRV